MLTLASEFDRSISTRDRHDGVARPRLKRAARRRFDPAALAAGVRVVDLAAMILGGAFALAGPTGHGANVTLMAAMPVLIAFSLLRMACARLSPTPGPALSGMALFAIAIAIGTAALSAWSAAPIGNAAAFALAAAGTTCIAARLAARHMTLRAHAAGLLRRTAVIVGATDAADRLIARNAADGDLDIVAVFDDRVGRAPPVLSGVPVFGSVDRLLAWEELPEIDQVIIAVGVSAEGRVRELLAQLRVAPNRVVLLLDVESWTPEPTRLRVVAGAPALELAGAGETAALSPAKRAFDILASLALLAFALPVIASVALAVRLDSPGPVLFRQRRVGINNRAFTVFKFRTMRHTPSEPARLVQVQADDARVTRIGRFLRSTSLDELPQLLNVLAGDMSLVGPRPHAPDMRVGETHCATLAPEYPHRCRVRPGLTGWAQVNGSRGPLGSVADVEERVRLDLEYIQRASLWMDLLILLRTAPAILGDRLRRR